MHEKEANPIPGNVFPPIISTLKIQLDTYPTNQESEVELCLSFEEDSDELKMAFNIDWNS